MKKETRLNHPARVTPPEGNEPVLAPIYQSVKFTFPTIAQSRGAIAKGAFYYSRGGNPTVRQLERTLADLQGTEDALAFGSGMAAISTCLLANLKSGDEVALFVESYKPTRVLARDILSRYGIGHGLLTVGDDETIRRVLARPETRVLFLESPTNPMLKIHDLDRLVSLAREHDVITILDNTFAGFHNHADYDIDYYVHSLTKFASGNGDVMGGLVAGSTAAIRQVRRVAVELGPVLDPGVAFQIQRSLSSYFVRYRQQSANAAALARHLADDPRVSRVLYPGLENDPGHALACRQMHDFGAIVTIDVGADEQQAWAFIDALELFTTCASLGSAESLAAPILLYLGTDLSATDRIRSGIRETSVRLAVGLEHVEDLIADVDQALERAIGARS